MSENAYAAPLADLIEKDANTDTVLASRGQRLWASIIDSVIQMAIVLPLMYFTGGFEGILEGVTHSIGYTVFMAAVGIATFIVINGRFLLKDGQTVGKRVVGIKIVDMEGDLAAVTPNLVKRYVIFLLPGQIPVLGQIFSFINILFIFGKKKRCIHDLFGKTQVVQEI
ncbi:MAG: RDD family protein [Lentisphaeraceae bacterium]|nr:RDD family protein [Lentisphaeraceae bacterium]